MAELELRPNPRVGCLDKHAVNYDSTATLPCSDCCTYAKPDIVRVGCTDRLAYNYDSTANKSCEDCCRYEEPINPPILGDYRPQAFVLEDYASSSTFPYDINIEGASCIRDTNYEESWVFTEGDTTFYGNGYKQYEKDLYSIINTSTPVYVPNWGTSGSLTDLQNAFSILLQNKPNSRVYINNVDLTPWIIPLYSNDNPITPNPNQNKFKEDCALVTNNFQNGSLYIYEEGGSATLPQLETQLNETELQLTKTQKEYNNFRELLASIKRNPTPEELAELERLEQEIKDLTTEVRSIQTDIKVIVGGTDLNTSYVKNHFMACLCEVEEVVEPVLCKTTSVKGETYPISPNRAECVKGFEDFLYFIRLQRESGNLSQDAAGSVIQTSFFNTFLLTKMGISQDDALFIIENLFNYSPAYYPYNSTTLDTINGATRAKNIINNAFLSGANIWLPLSVNLATDIVHSKKCCDLLGGIFDQGSYTSKIWNGKYYTEAGFTTGVCLCNEIKEPCPTFSDGTIRPITEVVETRTGAITTTYVNVSEECCSNTSLQSKMPGNWTWDGTRCVLINEDNSNTCEESTIITISETPINIRNVDCLEDTVTVTAYVYFEEPNNKCTNGVLTNDAPDPLSDEMIFLYKNPPRTLEEVSRFSKKTYNEESNFGDRTQKEYEGFYGPADPVDPTDPSDNPQSTNCCYDTETPIEGLLILQDTNKQKINAGVTYIDTFNSTATNINTNTNNGTGFNKWVKLTTIVDISTLNGQPFNVAVEFTQGLFKCCNYDIYFDDIQVGCLQPGVREIYNTEKCPGFELRHVIDNKKSWVYNPGTEEMSDSVEDNIIRSNGTLGMNIAQSNPLIIDGGHGPINRVFAPSVDAELPFRDTDYFGFHGVIERHSKLVLNSKEVILQFNMCPDGDCVINPAYLIDDYGKYILDDFGGRIIINEPTPFPNLLQLETFKKTFQGFWVQFMEQFIPATTIFVSGEKWCNSRICSEMLVADYLLDVSQDDGVLSPATVDDTIEETPNESQSNTRTQTEPTTETSGEKGDTVIGGETGSTNTDELKPMIAGNTKIYSLEALDPDPGIRTRIRKLAARTT